MFKRKSVNLAALLALGAISAPVFAQQAAPAPAPAAQQLERVEITGTRIKTVNTETASPVITLGAEAIKIEARRDVEGLLNNLPQVFADQGGEVSNGSSGTATVNLRNLGADRTLVLINGRRMPAGSPRQLATDLNQIPVSLIKRVEVLTGGASAIYGSDAVAGVVNFVMNDKFEGVDLDLNYQFYNHKQQADNIQSILRTRAATNPAQFKVPGDVSNDGAVKDFALTMGSNFANGKGNATVFVGRKQTDALLQSERDFTACALNYNTTAGFSCGGSGTSFPGQFTDFATYALTVADANGTTRPYVGATDQYNFGPTNYFQRPSNRSTAAAFINYDISDMAKAYMELNFHDDRTVAQIAPSGLFFLDLSGANAVRFENPLLSADWKSKLGLNAAGDTADVFIARRNVEGGGRQDDIRHTSYRGVIGVKGDIGNSFGYDLFAQSGRTVYQQTYKNDFSIARSTKAMDVVTDPATGQAVCRSKLDGSDPNCVPYNIWSLGKVTPEALAYLQTPGFQKGFTSQNVTGANFNGDLTDFGVKSPLASTGLGFAVGIERRTEKMELSTDAAFTTGDLAGQGGPTIGVGGQYSVNDVFAEMRMPLIERQPFAELLNLSASYRKSNYSTKQSTNTYGLGLEYAPIKAVKFRGSYQEASRAANIIELFAAQSIGLYDNDADPCAGATPLATREQCARTGVTAAQYGTIPDSPAGQYNLIGGGNPNLKPEEAKSTTFGVVFQPLRDLSVSLDYFNIKVDGTISTLGATVTLQQCLNTGNPTFCSLIQRDRVGSLWATPSAFIVDTNTNIGSRETEGLDIGVDYSMKMAGMGKVDFSVVGTYLNKFVTEDIPGLATYDCAGYFGDTCGTPLPTWRHKLRATWTTPYDLQLSATWRHIAEVEFERRSSQTRLAGSAVANVPYLGARDYLDVSAAYFLTKNLTVRLSINNLLDKDPPIRTNGAGFVNGNTYPVVYDSAGRRVSLNLNAKF
jgi:outer membrane receptor protein involved in Fe transport